MVGCCQSMLGSVRGSTPSGTTNVPGRWEKELRTCSGIMNRCAYSTQRRGQHLGAAGRHLGDRVVVDDGDAAGRRHNARIGGEDAVHVGVDLADVGAQSHGQRHGGGVGAAATERGGVAALVDALEAGHDRHAALVQGALHAVGLDGLMWAAPNWASVMNPACDPVNE